VQGRERIYLDRSWNELSGESKRIDEGTRQHVAALYARPRAMHDAFEQFGTLLEDAVDNKALLAKGGKITMPVFAIGAEKFSARTWPIMCSSLPAMSRAASCPTPGTGSWRRIHRPPSSWLQISSPSRLGFQTSDAEQADSISG
jgi:hypothetical protein